MKVAFDHHIFMLERYGYGGGPRYIFELASRLPAQGVSEVCVVAPLHINNYLAVDSARGFTRGTHLPYTLARLPGFVSSLWLANQYVAPLAWRGVHPDIVHETYYAFKPVGKAQGRVVTVYDMIYELFPEEFPNAQQWSAAKRAAVDRADHIICISENTRRDLIRLFDIDPGRTSVVHLGYSMTAEPNVTKADFRPGRPSLLYVGNRLGYKNFSTLLQAYSSSPILREFELVAFGGHPLLPGEQREIRRLGIGERVRFESGSDRELAAWYQAASAFIFPSKYEGFGLPPLEAMSHGCPVVCSNAGSIPEVVGDAGVYFDPDSAEDLRVALERVATGEQLQADLRARGYARIAAFSWDKCAAETAQIYREII
ncbi:glycosyltransferase family 1 protein [Mycobacterium sp. 852002-30065_SCH5024008]|uniref:glycosyltransferase family 4 protein n=1 Tax=Mycobacterium sp. 852002-30065_SCH5024008 TaxID=1834088 RepID=UPI0007FDE045|nr:glycosyltransferase family 1 protein [Mycobacterium sp. 852002-30065_SCH5024008]OBB97244.1 glycosyl transferase family 1 [Mycobacterium sp. 852002-30065_SCH5024008]